MGHLRAEITPIMGDQCPRDDDRFNSDYNGSENHAVTLRISLKAPAVGMVARWQGCLNAAKRPDGFRDPAL